MSLLTLYTAGVVIPLCTIFVVFVLFYLRAQFAKFSRLRNETKTQSKNHQPQRDSSYYPTRVPVLNIRSQHRKRGPGPVQKARRRSLLEELDLYAAPAFTPDTLASDTLASNALDCKPTYQPLSHYLQEDTEAVTLESVYGASDGMMEDGMMEATAVANDTDDKLTAIPGITPGIERELLDLGYTSIEEIARWGRADVRAVSAGLGVAQHLIEEGWVASARLILSLR